MTDDERKVLNVLDALHVKYPARFAGKFITFGEPLIDADLLAEGWMGLAVRPLDSAATPADRHLLLTRIVGQLSTDSGFRRVMQGYWCRVFPPREVFDQFAGPHHLIVLNTEGMNRWVWDTPQVQASAPHAYVMPEDGHNEAVVELAKKRSYEAEVVDGWLVLWHGKKHDYCQVCKWGEK